MSVGLRIPGVKRLTRHVLHETLVPCGLAITVIGFVAVANEVRERVTAKVLPVEFITWADMGRLILYFVPTLAGYVIPISYMMGVLLAFGRFSQDNEIMGMTAAGIPVKRAVLPVVVLGLLLSVVCFILQDRIQPAAIERANTLVYRDLPMRATLDVLPTGVMHSLGDLRVYIGGRDSKTRTLQGVVIVAPQKDGRDWVYYAESAQFAKGANTDTITMHNARLIVAEESGYAPVSMFPTATLTLPRPTLDDLPNSLSMLTLTELMAAEKTLSSTREVLRARIEIGERISLPMACLAVSLVSAPLVARTLARGRTYSFAIGFTLMAGYFILLKVMEPRALVPLWLTIARCSTPNLLYGGLGLWALWRADRV